MTEIASINNRVFRTLSSPIVIAPDEWITIKPETGSDDHYVVTFDGYEFNHKHIKKLSTVFLNMLFASISINILIFGIV